MADMPRSRPTATGSITTLAVDTAACSAAFQLAEPSAATGSSARHALSGVAETFIVPVASTSSPKHARRSAKPSVSSSSSAGVRKVCARPLVSLCATYSATPSTIATASCSASGEAWRQPTSSRPQPVVMAAALSIMTYPIAAR